MKQIRLSITGKLFRGISFLSVFGIVYGIIKALTVSGPEPIYYWYFMIPIWGGICLISFIVSMCLQIDADGNLIESRVKKLNIFTNILIAVGIVALLCEAIAILFEGKTVQCIELFVFCAILTGLKIKVNGLNTHTQKNINITLIGLLFILGVAWFPILFFILDIFD
ncbi:hypothetical protein ACFL54_07285 [Planctomycetota bacterium]